MPTSRPKVSEQRAATERRKLFEDWYKQNVPKVVAALQRKFPDLQSDFIEIIVSDAFAAAWRELERDDSTDPDLLLKRLYWNAARDVADRHRSYNKTRNKNGRKTRIFTPPSDFGTERFEQRPELQVGYGAEREARDFLESQVIPVAAALPEQQRRIAMILAENWQDALSHEEITEVYRNKHGVSLSSAAVRSSLRQVKQKLGSVLRDPVTGKVDLMRFR